MTVAVGARRTSTVGFGTVVGAVTLTAFVAVAVAGRLHGSPMELVADGLQAPSWAHPFGTDNLGRDLLARTGSGAWTSLRIASGSVLLAAMLAVPLGVVAAWFHGRFVDGLLMRVVETAQVVPPFVLVLVLLGLGAATDASVGPVALTPMIRITVSLAVGFVPYLTRVVRTAALVELEAGYVTELRLLGVRRREILFGEVVPNIAPAVAPQLLLTAGVAVFAEGGLSFVGMGIPAPAPTLGNLIAEAGAQLLSSAWWYALIPGLVLVAGITGFNLVADAVTDRWLGADRRAR